MNEITLIKKRFHRSLEPFKVMLVHRRREMNEQEWMAYVEKTKERVLDHPSEYLGEELPPQKTIRIIVQEIFDELTRRMRSSAVRKN